MANAKKKKTAAANPGAKAQAYQMDPQVEAEVRRIAREVAEEEARKLRGELRGMVQTELQNFRAEVAKIARAEAIGVVQNSPDVIADVVGRALKKGSDAMVGEMMRDVRDRLSVGTPPGASMMAGQAAPTAGQGGQ